MKTIGTYRTLSLTKTVVMAKPCEAPDDLDSGNEGAHSPQKGLVILDETQAHEASRVRDVICHEAVHDWLEASGAQKLLQDQTKLYGEEYTRFEEQLVLKLAPAVSSSISSLVALVGPPECPSLAIHDALAGLKAGRE